MRKKIIAGNWKMNTDLATGPALANEVIRALHGFDVPENVEIVLCPPFVSLSVIYAALTGSRVRLGAQNVYGKPSGAFTGEVSGPMLVSAGCSYAIVGHSERRHIFAESDSEVGYRANAAVDAGLMPIICVGETMAEREGGKLQEVLSTQLRAALGGIFDFSAGRCVIAYEPVWAIGTGNTATPEQAQEAHAYIRQVIDRIYSNEIAAAMPILYGGSVRADNAADLFSRPDIDGALVGGASLKADEFAAIVRAAC